MRHLCKGNVAIVKGAVLAGCRSYYGYPITPASEIAEYAALYLPQVGGTFVQAESEVAAINMVYGAAAAGERVMTASSGPGMSLMQEGMSYIAGAELPCVVVDVVRGGPGLGNIAPEQSDYFAMVKGGGHGNYKNLVLAPASVQEMADLTILAFELADRYRNPAVILTDGFVGQMMEPIDLEVMEPQIPEKPWAVKGTAETRKNLVTSICLEPDELEEHVQQAGSQVQVWRSRWSSASKPTWPTTPTFCWSDTASCRACCVRRSNTRGRKGCVSACSVRSRCGRSPRSRWLSTQPSASSCRWWNSAPDRWWKT